MGRGSASLKVTQAQPTMGEGDKMKIRLLVLISIMLMLGLGCNNDGDDTTSGISTPNEVEGHKIKYSVDESPYASMMAKHIAEMETFNAANLPISRCYEWGAKIFDYRWNIMRADSVEGGNEKGLSYLHELNDPDSEQGKRYGSAFRLFFTKDRCPFDRGYGEELILFKQSLRSYLDYMNKMKLAAQYGYITLKDAAPRRLTTVYDFFSTAGRYYHTLRVKLDLYPGENDPEAVPARRYVGRFLMNLAEAHGKVARAYKYMDHEDPRYSEFRDEIEELISLSEEIDSLPKDSFEDLKLLDEKSSVIATKADLIREDVVPPEFEE